MDKDSRIFVAGHRGLVGSALLRRLEAEGFTRLVTRPRGALDLTDQAATRAFFDRERIDVVLLAAARVGGIAANAAEGADFIRDNLLIQTNVIDAAWRAGVRRLVFLGSSCIYPKHAPQPMTEEALLTGPLESTNEPYAVAKIAGITMCRAYRRQHGFDAFSLMPTNLYGPGDNFHPDASHVVPALIRRFHEARRQGLRQVVVWGTGQPRREFLHVDDLADAVVYLMQQDSVPELLNIGVGEDVTIAELAGMVKAVTGFAGAIVFDPSRPDGTPRKLLDVGRLDALGWRARIPLAEGLAQTYRWYVEHEAAVRGAA